jgi:BMFP domain-containing protein YqiC
MINRNLRCRIAELENKNNKLESKNSNLLKRVAQLEAQQKKPDFTVVGQYFWRVENFNYEKGKHFFSFYDM